VEAHEFRRILGIGLGRAILFLQQHDASPYRDAILQACLHSTAYDPQVEGSRAAYMFDIISLTGEEPFYREQILAALSHSEPSDSWDENQLFHFARLFAQGGDAQARQVMYDKFTRNAAAGYTTGATDVIELDGIDGLLFVADRLGERLLADEDTWEADYLLGVAKEHSGEEQTTLALNQAAATNPRIAAFVQVADSQAARDAQRGKKRFDLSELGYDEIKRVILDREQRAPRYEMIRWGQHAANQDLERAAQDLLSEQDTERLIAYLRIFRRRKFPLDHSRLLDLARHENDQIARDALAALEQIEHPTVRALGLRMLKASERVGNAVDLFVRNYQEGDYKILEPALDRTLESEQLHGFGFGIVDIFKAHPSSAAVEVLTKLYEYGPCSGCREDYVNCLIKLEALPDWMREECRHDANFDLREKFALPTGQI
jgi:hypothetical protein